MSEQRVNWNWNGNCPECGNVELNKPVFQGGEWHYPMCHCGYDYEEEATDNG